MGCWRRAPAAALLALGVLTGTSRAGDGTPERRAVILVRALSYDANLRDRIGQELVIAVLARKGHSGSEACSTTTRQGFAALGAPKVAGVPLKVIQLWYAGGEALSATVSAQGIDVLYPCEGLESDLPVVLEVSRRLQILTMGGSEEQVARGVALGVVFVESKPTLLVNITAAKNAGAALSSDLLRVARVIR
jgi:hypothetical protein